MSTGEIIGISIGSVAGVALIGGGAYFIAMKAFGSGTTAAFGGASAPSPPPPQSPPSTFGLDNRGNNLNENLYDTARPKSLPKPQKSIQYEVEIPELGETMESDDTFLTSL